MINSAVLFYNFGISGMAGVSGHMFFTNEFTARDRISCKVANFMFS